MPSCSVGAAWKSTLTLSCVFLRVIPSAAPGEQRTLLLPWARTPRGCLPQRCDSLFITPETHGRQRWDPGPEEESTTVNPQPDSWEEEGQAVPGRVGAQGSLAGPQRPSLLC